MPSALFYAVICCLQTQNFKIMIPKNKNLINFDQGRLNLKFCCANFAEKKFYQAFL
jgi:hypothetical protein